MDGVECILKGRDTEVVRAVLGDRAAQVISKLDPDDVISWLESWARS